MLKYYVVCMVVMNLLGFFLMMTDKRRARRHKRRISERTLLMVAALGGSLGSLLAMYLFCHKTRHPKFYISLPVFLLLHLALTVFLVYKGILT